MPVGLNDAELAFLRTKLKNGEYNGADIMHAWLAIDELRQVRAERDALQKDLDDARVVLRRLERERDALRADAERYRWLRRQDNEGFEFAVVRNPHFDVFGSADELDAAIDAAMKEQHHG